MLDAAEYNAWNNKKQHINLNDSSKLYFKEKEIWWCSIGLNIGSEENGKGELFNRPVLILKKYGGSTFLGVLISKTHNRGTFYYPITLNGGVSVCLLTHIRLLDTRRLTQKIVTLEENEFQNIRKALKSLI